MSTLKIDPDKPKDEHNWITPSRPLGIWTLLPEKTSKAPDGSAAESPLHPERHPDSDAATDQS